MAISVERIASLASAFGSQAVARVSDPRAKALALAETERKRAERLTRATERAEEWRTYSATDAARIKTLKVHYWPRARAIKNALSVAKAERRKATGADRQSALYREYRLYSLLARADSASARAGMIAISREDMHAMTSRFVRSAAWRRFTWTGGRDFGSRLVEPADIFQGALARAMDAGDTVSGIPAYGALYRHLRAEAAQVTRYANLEYRAVKSVLTGQTTAESEVWPELADTHSLRKLDTGNYATTEQHRESLAILSRESELASIDAVTARDARAFAILAGDPESFTRQLAQVLIDGATLAQVSDAIGITEQTIRDRIATERADMRSGIDHTESTLSALAESERELSVAKAQERHAATLRARYAAALAH